jgi:hypothetical protein
MQNPLRGPVFVLCLSMLTASPLLRAQEPSPATPPAAAPAPSPLPSKPHLKDNQPFTLKAEMQNKYKGWGRYSTLPLETKTIADLGDQGAKYVKAIELRCEGNNALLLQHSGETVEATGKLHMDGASPYYWNGVVLQADTVKLADGTVLQAHPAEPVKAPAGVESYLVTVTMQPHKANWPHETVDLAAGKKLPKQDLATYDGCNLNGGGDMLNCSCVDGFVPVRAGVVPAALDAKDVQTLPAAKMIGPATAQFALPDADANDLQIYQIVCKRK